MAANLKSGALWALLLLPAGLGVGWLVGRIPEPRGSATPSPTRPAAGASLPRPASAPVAEAVRAAESGTPANEVSSWTSLENAVAESSRNGKPILIDFSADWCEPCRRLKQEVFDDGTRGRTVQEAVIPVSVVDRAREYGRNPDSIENLQRQYGVEAFPTLVVYSPATGRVMKTRGYGDADQTVEWITQAANSVR